MPALPELRRLLGETFDEVLGQNLRESGDVEDELLRVERGELSAQLGERVDDAAGRLAHPGVEHGEESGGSSADDRDVLDIVKHPLTFAGPRAGSKPG
jgi:hypothetical protein